MPSLTDNLMNSDIPAKLDQSSFASSSCIPMALACGFAGLAVGGLIIIVVVYKCKGEKAGLQKRIISLETELRNNREDKENTEQLVSTVLEQKRELENQRKQLREQLDEVEKERERNKRTLQTVEGEITQREMTFDKPEELLRQKENLLQAQWKLDQTKKSTERQLLNIDKLLDPIEFQIGRIKNRRRDVAIFME
ncbi:myosin-2 heavy chain, non muscle [Lates calcarifer]|uniref:Myosin-2 heavy chain, non muscle n=1 Tax=Lates calcarifer TaxID=8187 RepID=A0AAJ7PQD0_LATCA|nr:myosin-2 heavy chain, non muscle [Lates calcarifer]